MRKRPDALRPHRSVPFGLATETGPRNKPTERPSGTGMRKRASTVRGGTGIGFAPARGFAWLARRRTATHGDARRRTATHGDARRRTATHGDARRRDAAHKRAPRRVASAGHASRGASPRAAAPAQASPPFARSTCALTQPPSGPARNDTTPAMSSGSPRRSSGGIFA
ncbi:periplasmic binding protein family protein [Burkholderia pseudomallei]|nr:periplasmic binding protein family protein [Burkholderia pseudomallei]